MPLLLIAVATFLVLYMKDSSSTSKRNNKTSYKVKHNKTTTKKVSSDKPKDDIRFNYATNHYALIKDKKKIKEENKKVNKYTVITLSSKEYDSGKLNIKMKKHPDPKKEKEKQQLLCYRKKNLISQKEYEDICKHFKLNSYFTRRVRQFDEDKLSKNNYIETHGWSLNPDDRKTSDILYKTHLENKKLHEEQLKNPKK